MRWRDVAAVAVDVAPRPILVSTGHCEERAVVGFLAQPVDQNLLFDRRKPLAALDPITHGDLPFLGLGENCSRGSFTKA